MARTRMVRAFSAGGVVFRYSPNALPHSPGSSDPPRHAAISPSAATTPASDPAPAAPLAGVEIALVGRSRAGMWALPKGTPRHGEDVSETALREVREETGLITRVVGDLGSIFYTFTRARTRYRKEVAHFLLEAIGGDVSLHDHEYDEVRWFSLDEALERLTFANDADVVRRAVPLLERLCDESAANGATASQAPPPADRATV